MTHKPANPSKIIRSINWKLEASPNDKTFRLLGCWNNGITINDIHFAVHHLAYSNSERGWYQAADTNGTPMVKIPASDIEYLKASELSIVNLDSFTCTQKSLAFEEAS